MNSVSRSQTITDFMPASRRGIGHLTWYQYGILLLTFSAVALVFFGLTAAFVAAGEDADRHPALFTSDAARPHQPDLKIAVDDPR